jgi:hypothetical protein
MPLDFTTPRAKPTLGARRHRPPAHEARERFPRPEVLHGLRDVGGYWTERSHEDMLAIRRYVDELHRKDEAHSRQLLERLPTGLTFLAPNEVKALVSVIAANETFGHLKRQRRQHQPEVMITRMEDRAAYLLRFKADAPTGSGAETVYVDHMLTDEEIRAHLYLFELVKSITDYCIELLGREVTKHTMPRPTTIPQH